MRLSSLFVAFLLLSPSGAQSTPQQSPPPATRAPEASSILARCLSAMTSAGSPVRDSIAQGTITFSDGRSGTITLKNMGPDRLRNEVNLSGDESVMVVAGGKGHVVVAGQTRSLPIWMTRYLRPPHLSPLSRISDASNPNTQLIYNGLEDVNGQPAHHIRLSTRAASGKRTDVENSISEFHVFVDGQTNLVVKTISYDFSPVFVENRTQVETYFSDYRLVSGVRVPFRITRYIRGSKDSEISLSTIQFNVGLQDTDFQ